MRISKISGAGAMVVAWLGLAGISQANAAYIAYLYQDGSNVVASGSGSLDTAGLTYVGLTSVLPKEGPDGATLIIGTGNSFEFYEYSPAGPTSFGTGNPTPASTSAGPPVGFASLSSQVEVGVPTGYISGSSLGLSSATFDNTTLATLGASDGTYSWTFGSGQDADSFTLEVGTAPPVSGVPEPTSLALLGAGVAALGLSRRRQPVWRGRLGSGPVG